MSIGLSCSDLSIGWSSRPLLTQVAFEFEALPACLPIVGQTGIGKSTLLYVLSGMAVPHAGTIAWRLPAEPRQGTTTHRWRGPDGQGFAAAHGLRTAKFGFVLQDAELIPCLSVAENIDYALRLRGVRENRPGRTERIRRAVADMLAPGETMDGEDGLLGKYPAQLSGGTRKRMALAAAVAHDPVVLFADEPTSGLDDPTGLMILASIRRWLAAGGSPGDRAFICVTHQANLMARGVGASEVLDISQDESAEPRVRRLSLEEAQEARRRRLEAASRIVSQPGAGVAH